MLARSRLFLSYWQKDLVLRCVDVDGWEGRIPQYYVESCCTAQTEHSLNKGGHERQGQTKTGFGRLCRRFIKIIGVGSRARED